MIMSVRSATASGPMTCPPIILPSRASQTILTLTGPAPGIMGKRLVVSP